VIAATPRPPRRPARAQRALAACATPILFGAAMLAATAVTGTGAGQGRAHAPDRELAGLLASALAEMPATTGVAVTHLASGRSAAVRGDQAFSPASVSKLPYLVRAVQMAERGELDLSRRTTLTRAHLRHGTGILQYHDAGLAPTLGDLVTEMVITSDNTATDLVVDAMGGVDAVNAWLTASGFAETQSFGRPDAYRRALLTLLDPAFATLTAEETTGLLYTMDGSPLGAHYLPIFSGARARWIAVVTDPVNRRRFAEERDRRTSSDRAFWLGVTTPAATARLLEAIERCTLTTPAGCERMRQTLRRQQLGTRRLPHYLDVPVGHKTGDGGRIANDVGIIYGRSGPIVVAFFANGITEPMAVFEDRIGRLGQRLVAHLSRLPSAPVAH